ncbi:hypothetical protein EYF80_060571 [Liparis tanakae]|uniref:Uncharacterized protein n=1 Tax=Liparis tanakae TaxID=230148 RepID=A0A4Z2EL30_9TELE|nr:hypothetical protein EYF80_060571 [Liparis tanakae]
MFEAAVEPSGRVVLATRRPGAGDLWFPSRVTPGHRAAATGALNASRRFSSKSSFHHMKHRGPLYSDPFISPSSSSSSPSPSSSVTGSRAHSPAGPERGDMANQGAPNADGVAPSGRAKAEQGD